MRGRRKPTALHILQGTMNVTDLRKRELEPVPVGELAELEAPAHFTERMKANWNYAVEHMPKGVAKKIDRALLKAYIEAETRHDEVTELLAMMNEQARLKYLMKGPIGIVSNPYNDILDKCARTLVAIARELGFSPAARPKLQQERRALPENPADDPWAVLRVIPGGEALH